MAAMAIGSQDVKSAERIGNRIGLPLAESIRGHGADRAGIAVAQISPRARRLAFKKDTRSRIAVNGL